MPATPDNYSSTNGSGGAMRDEEDSSSSAGASGRDEGGDLNLDSDEADEDEQMSGWCGELSDYVSAHPLKAVAISFMTGWVASRVLW